MKEMNNSLRKSMWMSEFIPQKPMEILKPETPHVFEHEIPREKEGEIDDERIIN